MRKIALVLGCLSGFFISASSQDFMPGFIVSANEDTVRGFVNFRAANKNSASCIFRRTLDGGNEEYTPAAIKAFGVLDYNQYESKFVSSAVGRQFMELIVKGELSLYSFQNTLYAAKDSLVVLPRPKKGEVTLRYIGALNILMASCAQQLRAVYSEEEIGDAIAKYNTCKGGQSFVVKSKIPGLKVNGTLMIGLDRGLVSMDGLEKFSYAKSISMPVGAGIRFRFPKSSNKWLASVEMFYDRKVHQVYDESYANGKFTRSDFLLKYSLLKLPVGLQYNFRNEFKTPYIKSGVVKYFVSNLHGNVVSETEDKGVVVVDRQNLNFAKKYAVGFWLGAGYQHRIRGSVQGFMECRYEVNSGVANLKPRAGSSGNNITLLAGIIF